LFTGTEKEYCAQIAPARNQSGSQPFVSLQNRLGNFFAKFLSAKPKCHLYQYYQYVAEKTSRPKVIEPVTVFHWLIRTPASRNLPMISSGRYRFFDMSVSSSDQSKKHYHISDRFDGAGHSKIRAS
jgi:hypothetical protein